MSQPPQGFPTQPQGPFRPAGSPSQGAAQAPLKQPTYRVPAKQPRKGPWWKSPWFLAPMTLLVGLFMGFSVGATAMMTPEARAAATAPRPTKTVDKTTTATATVTGSQSVPSTTPAPTVTVTATATVTTATTTTVTAAAPPPADSGIGDGSYLVGSEIAVGTWKSSGGGSFCYADTEDKAGNILEQEVSGAGGSVIIRVKAGAYTFTSRDCGSWTKVG